MSTEPESAVIIVFQPSVSKEQIIRYANDIEANGGKVKDRYYESDGLHGFSATIPDGYLTSFQNFQARDISYIESDGVVTTQ